MSMEGRATRIIEVIMARSGYKVQTYPNGEFTVGYVAPKKFTPEPLPSKGVEVFRWEWLDDEHKYLVAEWVKDKVEEQGTLGLSHPANSHKRGLNGITSKGARTVKNAAWLLQARYGHKCLSFVTLTLPAMDEQEYLLVAAQWSHVVRVYCQELKRELKRHGLPTGIVGVTEIQERRLKARGELGLHLHLVVVGRRRPSGAWSIPPSFHREVWLRILSRVVGRELQSGSCENVQMVRKSADSYLGKYLTKGVSVVGEIVERWGEQFVPSAWYTCTNRLRDSVKARVKVSWDLGETIWADLPAMDAEGALTWVRFHQIDIEGRAFTVGMSGRWELRRLRDAFPQYYNQVCHSYLREEEINE